MESRNKELGLDVATPFTLRLADGQDHLLTPLTLNGLMAAQKAQKGLADEAEKGATFLKAVLCQALRSNEPTLTLEQAGDLMPGSWLQLDAAHLRGLLTALGVQAEVKAEADPTAASTELPPS